jgi:hypothetical protein
MIKTAIDLELSQEQAADLIKALSTAVRVVESPDRIKLDTLLHVLQKEHDLAKKADELIAFMKFISEDDYSAGWSADLEHWLWTYLQIWREGGSFTNPRVACSKLQHLDVLQRECKKWGVFDVDDCEPVAISESVFETCYDTWLMKERRREAVDQLREKHGLLPLAATEAQG